MSDGEPMAKRDIAVKRLRDAARRFGCAREELADAERELTFAAINLDKAEREAGENTFASNCALCETHSSHLDRIGFHHVVDGERVDCAAHKVST